MIAVDGFLAFHGALLVSPGLPDYPPFTIRGDCLFNPVSNCWLVQPEHQLCRSFPADICSVFQDDSL